MIIKKYILIIFLILITQKVINGQTMGTNLVPNPGFEEYIECPFSLGQIKKAIPWDEAMGIFPGSSDYLNFCSNNIYIQQVLSINNPLNGNGCAAIGLYGSHLFGLFDNYREYIEVKLSDKLIKNKKYCIKFYTILSKYFNYATANIGLLITKDYVNSFDPLHPGFMIINDSIPQIINKNGIIIDSVNWSKISGLYYAKGDEEYITIGNFDDDNHTNWISLDGNIYGAAYYLVDDVSVCECSFDINLGQDTSLCEGESIILSPNLPKATYTWQDSSHAATFEVKQSGTYWVRAYVADYDITTTDTIVIKSGDDSYCNPPLTIPNVITPNGDSQNDNFKILNSEYYDIALQIYNRWGRLIYETSNYQNDFSCRDCADGVYFYVLKAKSKRNGREKEYKGSLTVING